MSSGEWGGGMAVVYKWFARKCAQRGNAAEVVFECGPSRAFLGQTNCDH